MRKLICLYFVFVTIQSAAQPPMETYPKGYFRNPLEIPINLSGNFGELRPNHYHMGLDLKTNARENLRVHAAADGYVARIKIEPGGFGRAIYINHPNGYTTLYAHLNEFNAAIERYVKEKQYELRSWSVQLDIPPGVLPVNKGDFIAFSGNTGGSQAPHLHFEVRRTMDDVNQNPMLFGFQLTDNTRPRILRLGIYDRRRSVFEQTPKTLAVKSTGAGAYTTLPVVTSSPLISLAISAYDTHTGSSNLNGIFSALLKMDGKEITGFRMNDISYNDTRYLNAHIDYRLKTAGGPYLQHLSELPGYQNSIYWKEAGDGVLDISDGEPHSIEIEVEDAYGNRSELRTKVQYSGTPSPLPAVKGKMFYPLMLDGEETDECEFFIPEQGLYDSVHINYVQQNRTNPAAVSRVHSIGNYLIPLQTPMLVRILPDTQLTAEQMDHTIMLWSAGSKKSVMKVEWQNGWAAARFRDFGSFQLLVDEEPPQIIPIGFADGSRLSAVHRLVFTVRDNNEKFKNVWAEIDGNWIRCSNDKGKSFIYRFDEHFPPGEHSLVIHAEDEAGNITEKTYRISR